MKRVFYLDRTSDTKEIGPYYPQCKGLIKEYINTTQNSIMNFANYKGRKVDFIPNLDGISIYKSTKLTDVISCALGPGNDLIISKRFFDLLKNFNTSPVQYFNCTIYKGEDKIKYVWLHFIYELEKVVDYKRSLLTHPNDSLSEDIKMVTDYEKYREFYDTKDKYGLVKAKKVVIKNLNMDFLVIGQYNQKVYISEKLRDAIVRNKITGIDIREADDIEID